MLIIVSKNVIIVSKKLIIVSNAIIVSKKLTIVSTFLPSFRKQCFDGLAVHVSNKLVLLPQCPCLSRERVVAQYLNIDVPS